MADCLKKIFCIKPEPMTEETFVSNALYPSAPLMMDMDNPDIVSGLRFSQACSYHQQYAANPIVSDTYDSPAVYGQPVDYDDLRALDWDHSRSARYRWAKGTAGYFLQGVRYYGRVTWLSLR